MQAWRWHDCHKWPRLCCEGIFKGASFTIDNENTTLAWLKVAFYWFEMVWKTLELRWLGKPISAAFVMLFQSSSWENTRKFLSDRHYCILRMSARIFVRHCHSESRRSWTVFNQLKSYVFEKRIAIIKVNSTDNFQARETLAFQILPSTSQWAQPLCTLRKMTELSRWKARDQFFGWRPTSVSVVCKLNWHAEEKIDVPHFANLKHKTSIFFSSAYQLQHIKCPLTVPSLMLSHFSGSVTRCGLEVLDVVLPLKKERRIFHGF